MVITWWAYLFDLESSIPFHFFFFSFMFNLLHFVLHFFHNLEGSINTAYFVWKETDSTDDSHLLTVSRLRFCRRSWGCKNLHQEAHCAFLEVIRLFQSFLCVRNGLQFRTVQQNQKSFLWTQDWGWTVCPHFIYGIWSSQFFTETRIRVIKNEETRARTWFVQHLTNFKHERNLMEWYDLDNVDFISSNVNSSRQEALLYVFEDNEVDDQDDQREEARQWDMFPEPTELLLIGCFRINSDPKIQIKYIDTRNQLADIQTKGNSTRDEWNHLLCLFNISHFSSTTCLEVMSKRTQEDSGEERVTAKSKPMMNLVSQCSVRDPNVLASTASDSPGKTRHESRIPLSSWTGQHLRTGRLVMGASSSNLKWNVDEKWSSQEWKSEELMEVRTVRSVSEQPAGSFTQHTDRFVIDDDDMDSDGVKESDMSFKSRSFLDVEHDDTALEEMLHDAHRVHVYDSQREGLSVGQSSSSSVFERTGRSVGERTGRLVGPSGQELNVGNAQIRTLLDRQIEQISPNVRRRLRNTNSRLAMTEEVHRNWVKLLNLSTKNFIALK